MSPVDERVRQAQGRLNLNLFLDWLTRAVTVALAIWLLLLIAQRLLVFAAERPVLLTSAAVALAVGLGVLFFGLVRHWIRRAQAALALDEAAHLKERLSTALSIRTDPHAFARAACEDAERTARGLRVTQLFPFRRPRTLPAGAAMAVVAALVWLFLPPLNLLAKSEEAASEEQQVTAEQDRREREAIEQRYNEEIEKLKELQRQSPPLAGLELALDPLDLPPDAPQRPEDVRRDAMQKLDELADQLKEQRAAGNLAMLEELQRQLKGLEQLEGNDLAAQLSRALAQGDLGAARQQLEQLAKQLEAAAQSDDPQQRQLARELQEQLQELAQKLNQVADNKRLQKELENKAGLNEEQAKKLLEQLQKPGADPQQIQQQLQQQLGDKLSKEELERLAKKIAQNQQAQQQLKQLAQQLQKACQACEGAQAGQPGQQQALDAAMAGATDQLSDLEMAQQMMQDLQMRIAQLDQARDQIGRGAPNANPSEPPGGTADFGQLGRGQGPNSQQRAPHQTTPDRLDNELSPGQIIGQTLIDLPPGDQEAEAARGEAIAAALRAYQDPVQREQIPQQYRAALKHYFERIAGLQGNSAAE
jgi:hypothetical protein